MSEKREQLIELGRKVISAREEAAEELDLSRDFLDGFQEGVAEFIGANTEESAADILEELDC